MGIELTTVADDEAVVHDGPDVRRYDGLDARHRLRVRRCERSHAAAARRRAAVHGSRRSTTSTSARPIAAIIEGSRSGPSSGASPARIRTPRSMNRGAIAEMARARPRRRRRQGRPHGAGHVRGVRTLSRALRGAFGDRLHHVRGNHDAYYGEHVCGRRARSRSSLPGVHAGRHRHRDSASETGQVDADHARVARRRGVRGSDRPVLVFGHHHVWSPGPEASRASYFGINPDDSDRLIELVAAPAAHHRLLRRAHASQSRAPVPRHGRHAVGRGRVREGLPGQLGGVPRLRRRRAAGASPHLHAEALAWTEQTRGMYDGIYTDYAFGTLEDRNFIVC